MRTQVFEHAAVIGKTITQIVAPLWGPTLLVFTDGTFAQLTADGGYEGETAIAWDKPFRLLDFPEAMLIEAGIMTQDEITTAKAHHEQERQQAAREARRREYERLRAEFEREG